MNSKIAKKLILTTMIAFIITPTFVFAQNTSQNWEAVEYALYSLYALTLVIVLGVIYNFWGVITSFGGLIGSGLNLIGSGVIILVLNIILRILSRFNWNYIELVLKNYPRLYEIFHACLQIVGLLLIVWGLKKLALIYKEEKETQSQQSAKNTGSDTL